MAKIHTLKISNFKGIQKFEQVFGRTDFICLIGRGDSGKTTILDAISAVLSPSWNLTFYDSDFFNGNIEEPIEIEASLYDLPSKLLSETKYGLYKRFLNNKGEIIDDVLDEDMNDEVDILTVRLRVNKDLEPKWHVCNDRKGEVEISPSDRASFNVFLVSDYIDRHFSWNKGNPLYSLLKQEDTINEKTNVIIDAFREAKEKIGANAFNHLDSVVEKIKKAASNLGVDIANTTTTIDFKDISIKDGRICLHEDKIPFRLKGKGSKRLISIAIQTELAKSGGILLIDEIEQGLEPDRAKHLVRTLENQKLGQIFITTHSRDVLVELQAENIFLMKKDNQNLIGFDESFQGCLRNNPEAFFAKRIIICEGSTEVGICRAIEDYRISKGKSSYAVLGIGIVNGTGDRFIKYCENFSEAGFDVCVFVDSDKQEVNTKKETLKLKNIKVFDCEAGNAIEKQIFADLPWEAVQKLIDYAIDEKGETSIKDLIKNQNTNTLPDDWYEKDTSEIRIALGKASTFKKEKKSGEFEDKGWFKSIYQGEFLGFIWCSNLDNLNDKTLGKQFEELSNWIDNA
ncbi:MAG: ATP-binding protein [Ignavibacteria bacterium]|nr:ATP-binding protein [Ignavibacteria bacterium]